MERSEANILCELKGTSAWRFSKNFQLLSDSDTRTKKLIQKKIFFSS